MAPSTDQRPVRQHTPGNTSGPYAAGDPFASVFAPNQAASFGQEHVAYRDQTGTIWDCWYDPASSGWSLQQINLGGRTQGPAAVSGPFIWTWNPSLYGSEFDDEQHFAYVDANGRIWDSWYDAPSNNWSLQQLNLGGRTNGPAAAGGLAVGVFFDAQQANQWHVAYRDESGVTWDLWFDGPSKRWNRQQVNLGVATRGPAAVGDPFLWVWAASDGNQQLHITYADGAGKIWDAFWDVTPGQPGGRAGP